MLIYFQQFTEYEDEVTTNYFCNQCTRELAEIENKSLNLVPNQLNESNKFPNSEDITDKFIP